MVKIWVGAFWGEPEPVAGASRVGVLRHARAMGASTAVLVAGLVAIAVLAGPFYEFAADAARQLLDPSSYVSAVRSS